MGHRECESARQFKSTPEGEALGNRVIKWFVLGSIATFVVVGLGFLIYFSMVD